MGDRPTRNFGLTDHLQTLAGRDQRVRHWKAVMHLVMLAVRWEKTVAMSDELVAQVHDFSANDWECKC